MAVSEWTVLTLIKMIDRMIYPSGDVACWCDGLGVGLITTLGKLFSVHITHASVIKQYNVALVKG